MDRPIVYTQEQGRSTDFMFANRSAMVGLAKIAEVILGSSTWLAGLACTATAPASLSVDVAPGQIYSNQPIDATAYGVLAADTAHSVLKQGVALDATTLACPAPTTSGYSINYLVQVGFQETDATNAVLPFFNSANPSQPYSGQNNTGTALPTERQDKCIVAVKAGAAAATGSQTTPSPDAGYIGAYVVTVAYGQTTITSTSISVYPNAPFIPADGVLRGLQLGETQYAPDTGTANAIAIALSPAPTALTDGMVFRVKAANDNTGATTVNPNGLGAIPAYANGAAMVGGEIKAGGYYGFEYDATNNVAHLMAQSKGLLAGAFIGGNKSVFTANGTFVVPANVTKIWVSAVAGGGGGGGGGGTVGSSGNVGGGGGGGGGAGQSTIKQPISVTPGDSLSITIGAAGAGGAGGANTGASGANGTAGGNTVLTDSTSATTLLTLAGGGGGAGGAGQTSTTAGLPGGGPGGSGGPGYPAGSGGSDGNYTGNGGNGVSNPFGGGGGSGRAANGAGINGNASGGYGSGGGGGGGVYGPAANAGGNGAAGAPGFLVIEW